MASNSFGIDLGTSNIKIYNKLNNCIINEKNMVAIKDKKKLIAVGNEAFEMYEKNPGNIRITYPLGNGVISNIKSMQTLLQKFIGISTSDNIKNSDYYIATPTDITEVEKRAFTDLIRLSNIKAKKVYLVDKPIADAIGMNLDVITSRGILVVNIGADTTEISVLSLGGVVLSKLIRIGGNRFDESIQSMVKKEYDLIIGNKTAELLKIRLGCAIAPPGLISKVYGQDIVSGLPVETSISSSNVYEALKGDMRLIIDAIKVILERTPPELASDILDGGIYVSGGSSEIRHLKTLVEEHLELKTNILEKPSESVIRGISRIINEENYKSLAYAPKM